VESQDRPEHDLPDTEADYLLGLLDDYADKLRARMDVVERTRTTLLFSFVGLVLLSFISAVAVNELWITNNDDKAGYVIVGWIVALVAGVAPIYYLSQRAHRNRVDMARLAETLTLLVQRASQLEEHGKTHFAQRVALDVRLSEAEAILKEAGQSLLRRARTTPRPSQFSTVEPRKTPL
jgi:hypothetical protein